MHASTVRAVVSRWSVSTPAQRVSCYLLCAAQVEETLKPKALSMGNGLTWEGMMGDLQPKEPWPSTAKLTAYALYDGTCTNGKAGEAPSVVPVLTIALF